jgi:hypothetical protein
MLVIPDTWEVEIEESWFKANLGKKLVRPYLKNNPSVVVHGYSIPATYS